MSVLLHYNFTTRNNEKASYLVDDGALGASDRLQPALPERRRFLGDSIEMPVVVVAAVARPELAVREPARRRHH